MTSSRHLEPVPEDHHEDAIPHDHGAEQVVLGAMMLSADAVAEVTDIVTANDFYEPRHAELFTVILDAFSAGQPTDMRAITTRLANTGSVRRYGNGTYLADLVEAVPTIANAAWYARTIAGKAARWRLLEAAAEIRGIANTHPDDDPTGLADAAAAALYSRTDQHITTDVVQVGDLITSALDAIQSGTHDAGHGLRTGITELDRATGGPQPGQLWILAGRPGMGKSVHATDLARSVAIHAGKPVLFFSLEMSKEELMDRLMSAEASVRHERLLASKRGELTLSDAEWTALARAAGKIGEAPLYVDETATIGLAAIRAKTRRLAQRGGLSMVIVDYLQLMQTTARKQDNREREVADLSRGLKLLAKEIGVPVIAVSQLNRGPEQRMDKTPQLGDLRESGGLENDADVVILVHRDQYYTKDKSERPGEVDLIVAKNRHGSQPTVAAAAQLHYQRFADMAAN